MKSRRDTITDIVCTFILGVVALCLLTLICAMTIYAVAALV